MATLNLAYTAKAIRLLHEILGFVAQENPDAASKISERIEHGLDHLCVFPDSGRKIPEAPERSERELVIPPCVRIFYRVDGDTLWVIHAMRAEQAFKIVPLDE